jgi:hypothetical protein
MDAEAVGSRSIDDIDDDDAAAHREFDLQEAKKGSINTSPLSSGPKPYFDPRSCSLELSPSVPSAPIRTSPLSEVDPVHDTPWVESEIDKVL